MKIENNDKGSSRPVEGIVIANEGQASFRKKYWELLNRLTPKEYIVLALSLGGLSNGDLVDDLKVTKQNISRIKKNIKSKWQKVI
jgi:DNA-binding NarL/FixJ family response regulator